MAISGGFPDTQLVEFVDGPEYELRTPEMNPGHFVLLEIPVRGTGLNLELRIFFFRIS